MKATGIIRRIDDLGRIVIPKEIRKTLRIKSGENLEIFTGENENIILRKFNQIDSLRDLAIEITNSIYRVIKKNIIITNNDIVISTNNALRKEYLDKEISNEIIKLVQKRNPVFNNSKGKIKIINNKEEINSYIFCPILVNGDIGGSIILLDENITESDFEIIKIAAYFLANHLEG